MSAGGVMSLISIRLTLTPQGEVAASITRSSRSLISSRLDSISSRSIEPTTVRRLVIVSWTMAFVQVVDPVGGFGSVHHLDEDQPVDLDGGVVLGDDVLLRDVEHLLHHVHLRADSLDEGRQQADAPGFRVRVYLPKRSTVQL